MGWKARTFAGFVLVGAAAAVVLTRVPGHYLASEAEVKRAVRALYGATAELRDAIGIEVRALRSVEPDLSERQHPAFGAYDVRINESGTIVVRSRKYDVVLVFIPLPGGEKQVPWRCRIAPAEYVIEGCEPGGEE
ncbi:MAG: hypothetical protein R3357_14760 [Burkholderiales bacterium]|nr:hypothetical protein [Burkholderiales bacterium]